MFLLYHRNDKGNCVVILNKADYCDKINTILCDTSKFNLLNRENKQRTFLGNLKNENVMSDELYHKLASTGSRHGILYELPKVHKANVPLRPILSAIGTQSCNLSRYLVSLLRDIFVSLFIISVTFFFHCKTFVKKKNCAASKPETITYF